jgi:GNAT superfamily N-acetyltransferase
MEFRKARPEDAEEACMMVRRSIVELCHADHQGDASTISAWLANKTTYNMRQWIAQMRVFVATEYGRILGVCALKPPGEITLNYVSPDARFRGVTKALLRLAELEASDLGAKTVMLQSSLTALRFYRAAGYRSTGPPIKGFGITSGYPLTKLL